MDISRKHCACEQEAREKAEPLPGKRLFPEEKNLFLGG
jgi:hypothetical protein